jgi:hypothetical protein
MSDNNFEERQQHVMKVYGKLIGKSAEVFVAAEKLKAFNTLHIDEVFTQWPALNKDLKEALRPYVRERMANEVGITLK